LTIKVKLHQSKRGGEKKNNNNSGLTSDRVCKG